MPQEIDREYFLSVQPQPRFFFILSPFSFVVNVFIIARSADHNTAKAATSGYDAALVLLSLDRQAAKIFSRILGGPPAGAKTAGEGFFILRSALNSASQCQDGVSSLKNVSRVELREYKVGQCVDDTNICTNLYRDKSKLLVTLTFLPMKRMI